MADAHFHVASISWIDAKPLPSVGFWSVATAAISWPNRVVMGLVGTANPEPPAKIESFQAFAATSQYRALLAADIAPNAPQVSDRLSKVIIDPGYTPPFDKTKLNTHLRSVAPIPDDPAFYAGELSPLSAVVFGKLHKSSTLSLKFGDQVYASGFIKFRAGGHTDEIGLAKANSPVHVPWVWCEWSLVNSARGPRLLCNGSVFPSHAWYVNGQRVATQMQCQVTASKHDQLLNTGQPGNHLRDEASADKSQGAANTHQHAVSAGAAIEVALPTLDRARNR